MKAITRWGLVGVFVAMLARPAVVQAIILRPPPIEDVSGFTAVGGDAQVFLRWTYPTDENLAGVIIRRKIGTYPTNTTDGTSIYTGSGTNVTDAGLINGTPYYYTAFSDDGYGDYSAGARATATPQPSGTLQPANVSGFSATEGDTQVVLCWTNPTNANFAGVKILRQTGNYPSNTTDGTVVYIDSGTNTTDMGLANDATYYYKAFSYDVSMNYANGVTASATPHCLWICTTNSGTVTITQYRGSGGAVTIPGTINGLPVTGIGSNVFYSVASLTSVTIPNNVTRIGSGAFEDCENLAHVTLPSSVVDIGDNAFSGCGSLSGSVTIGNGVSNIGAGLFEDCVNLTSVILPNTVTNIGRHAFSACYSLVNLSIPTNVTTIGEGAYFECLGMTSETIPDSVTSIGDWAFGNCWNLTSITIGGSVTNIGGAAFGWCFSLAGMYFEGDAPSPTFIFYDDGYPYPTIYYLPGTKGWASIFSGAYTAPWILPGFAYTATNGTISILGYTGSGGAVMIPDTFAGRPITSISGQSFSGNSSLTSVSIPASVTNLGNTAFGSCPNLTAIYLKGNPPSLGSSVFTNDNKATVYCLKGTTNPWGGQPTVLWNPQVKPDATFSVRTNCFGFTFTNAGSPTVVVEACTNLADNDWLPVATNTLTAGSSHFADSGWTNYPARFYRFRMP